MSDRLLAPEDVARRCGLSRRAVYRAIERGELPASRLCSRLRVRSEDVESWVDAHRVEAVFLPSPEPQGTRAAGASRRQGGLRSVLAEYDREGKT